MNYRIVEKEAVKAFGVGFVTSTVNNVIYKEIPEFVNRIFESGGIHIWISFLSWEKQMILMN